MRRIYLHVVATLCYLLIGSAEASAPGAGTGPGSSFTRVTFIGKNAGSFRVSHAKATITARGPASVSFASKGHLRLHISSSTRLGMQTVLITADPDSVVRTQSMSGKLVMDIFQGVQTAEAPRGAGSLSDVRTRAGSSQVRQTSDLIPDLPSPFRASSNSVIGIVPRQASALDPIARPSERSTPVRDDNTQAASHTTSISAQLTPSVTLPHSASFPFSSDVGVAILRRAGGAAVFFDQARPLDLSAVHTDAVFGKALVTIAPSFTRLWVPLEPTQRLVARHDGDLWRLSVESGAPKTRPVMLSATKSGLLFALRSPGRTFSAPDPDTGAIMLIGTDRQAQDACRPATRSALFATEETEAGVAIEPFSERLVLRPTAGGFMLGDDQGLGLWLSTTYANPKSGDTSAYTRSLDLESLSAQTQTVRLRGQLLAASRAPIRQRFRPRLDAAQTMLSLGLGREALTLLHVALVDEPTGQDDPKAIMIGQIGAFLDGQIGDGDVGLKRDLALTDEARLWDLLRASSDADKSSSSALLNLLPLLLSYPEPLRDAAAARAAEVFIGDGRPESLRAITELPETPRTMVPKALASMRLGRALDASRSLEGLSRSADIGTMADAILANVAMKVKNGAMTPSDGAHILERHALDWRVTGKEPKALLEEADLLSRGHQPRAALAVWRELRSRNPETQGLTTALIGAALDDLSEHEGATSMSPADFVSLVRENAADIALVPARAARIDWLLADRLEALDLPDRASDVMEQLLSNATSAASHNRAEMKLAEFRLRQGDGAGCKKALDGVDVSQLSADIITARQQLLGRCLALSGDEAGALADLSGDTQADALTLQASLFAKQHDWRDTKLTLTPLVDGLPGRGVLDQPQADMVIQLATAALRDNDTSLVGRVVSQYSLRMPDADHRDSLKALAAVIPARDAAPSQPTAGPRAVSYRN